MQCCWVLPRMYYVAIGHESSLRGGAALIMEASLGFLAAINAFSQATRPLIVPIERFLAMRACHLDGLGFDQCFDYDFHGVNIWEYYVEVYLQCLFHGTSGSYTTPSHGTCHSSAWLWLHLARCRDCN